MPFPHLITYLKKCQLLIFNVLTLPIVCVEMVKPSQGDELTQDTDKAGFLLYFADFR